MVDSTRGNLQSAFKNEVNTKESYLGASKMADREGYPCVARLFRACARVQQVHAAPCTHQKRRAIPVWPPEKRFRQTACPAAYPEAQAH